MQNKGITRTLLGVGLLTLACGVMLAQNNKVSPQQAVTKGSNIVHTKTAPPPGLSVLFSNLGSSTDAYDETNGWLIEGPDNTVTFSSQAIANPYTPTANSTIRAAQIALGYDGSGTNNAAIAIYTDAGGLPGTPIRVYNVSNLPTFGTCCTLVAIGGPDGLQVTAGTQYWIVAGTDNKSSTAYDVWNYTWNDSQGPIAYGGTATGGVWTAFTGNQNAFALYGTTP
jgi:hypothetical protein